MTRKDFLQAVIDQIGLLYGWGFKGFPVEPYVGRDCSGVITSAINEAGGGDLRAVTNAQTLANNAPKSSVGKPGDFAFYGPNWNNVDHVMVVLNERGAVVGAHGGDHTTNTVQRALEQGAQVGTVRTYDYRSDFLGFKSLNFEGE